MRFAELDLWEPVAACSSPLAGQLRAEFPIFERCTYLNSCSLGALSRRSRARVNAYLDLWDTRGASAWYDTWWAALEELRTRYGRLLGAAPGSVALHPNVSSALGVVASALDYRARPRVVVTSLDFPTIGYQWMAKARDGVEVVVLESPDGVGVPLEMYERAVDRRTALVATSHVFFTSGAIQDAAAHPRHRPPRGRALPRGRVPGGGPAPGGRSRAGRGLLSRRRPQVAARRDRRGVPVRAARPAGGAPPLGDGLVCAPRTVQV